MSSTRLSPVYARITVAGQSIFDVVNERQLAVARLIVVQPLLLRALIQVIVTVLASSSRCVSPPDEVANNVAFKVTGDAKKCGLLDGTKRVFFWPGTCPAKPVTGDVTWV